MSNRKTNIDPEKVKTFLQKNWPSTVSDIIHMDGGEISDPFAFTANGEEFIIRVDTQLRSYQKDKYAYEHFSSMHLPIPEVISIGKFDESHYFAISKKLKGTTLDKLSVTELHHIMPSLIKTLDYIHSIEISDTKGYGYWDERKEAPYKTWKEYIGTVREQNPEWKNNPNFQYIDILEKINAKMLTLIKYCPEDRYLVHRDFGFNNALADSEKITGIIDWGESIYGDFVFDIAWLDVWQDSIKYEDIFATHYKQNNRDCPHLRERVQCYKLNIYYGSIIFFVQSNQIEEADKLIVKIQTEI